MARTTKKTAKKKTAAKKKTTAKRAVKKKVVKTPKTVAPEGIQIKRAVIAPAIEKREPQGAGTSFPADIKRLYCFTEVINGQDSEIQHKWYWNGTMISTVNLKITTPRYRTYSAKTIVAGMAGKWKVEIVDAASSDILEKVEFTIQ